jgi:hypothetical protein
LDTVKKTNYNQLKSKPKRFNPKFKKKQEEEKFDIEKWLKQHQNVETPKRGKKNSLGDKKNKRRH